MFIFSQIFKLVKLINSETGKWQIAFGFAFGMLLGLAPGFGLHTVFVLFLACIFRINLGALFLGWAFFGIVALPFDKLFHQFGYYLLVKIDSLHGAWTAYYNMPIMPWSKFNNTVMMGSLAIAKISFIPFLILCSFLVDKYRDTVREKIKKSKIFKALKATKIYGLYKKWEGVKGLVT